MYIASSSSYVLSSLVVVILAQGRLNVVWPSIARDEDSKEAKACSTKRIEEGVFIGTGKA